MFGKYTLLLKKTLIFWVLSI